MSKLFGRDPAMVTNLAGSIIVVVSLFLFPLTIDQQGALNGIVAAVVGLITWRMVQADGHVALLSGFAKAVLAVALSFGLHWNQEHQAAAMALVMTISQFAERSQMTAAVPLIQKEALTP